MALGVLVSCSGPVKQHADSDSGTTKGGGPLVYRNYDLHAIDPDGRIVSAVVGFSTVEIVNALDEPPAATALVAPDPAPSCDRMPIAVVPGDYGSDGQLDLWIHEACGGNWVANGPEFSPSVRSEEALSGDPGPFEFVDYVPSGPWLIGGTTHAVYLRQRLEEQWSDPTWFSVPRPVSVRVARLWATWNQGGESSPDVKLLFQGDEVLFVLAVREDGLVVDQTLVPAVEPPYVAPFSAFDHLAAIPAAACANTALGIGLFASAAGNLRRIQIVRVTDGAYHATDQDLPLDDVTTFTPASLVDGRIVVGVLGKRSQRDVFVLATLMDCNSLVTVAELEVTFDLRTPPLPPEYADPVIPLTSGVELISFVRDGAVHFVHYDGYDVRAVVAQEGESGWQLGERQHEVHSERADSSVD